MASLGSLGRRKPAIDLDFDWFGTTIRVNPVASDLIEIDFLRRAQDINLDGVDLTGEMTAEAASRMTQAAQVATDAVVGSVRRIIHPDDWETFWSLAIANGQNLADLMEVQKAITEAVSGFPTGQPSASPPGPPPTPPRSEDVSPSPESTTPGLTPEAVRSLHRLEGRPDLQVAILRAQEARAGQPVSA